MDILPALAAKVKQIVQKTGVLPDIYFFGCQDGFRGSYSSRLFD